MIVEWLLANIHLFPSFIFFFSGLILLILAPILYQIRKRRIIILNPIKAIREYSRFERRLLIVGTILALVGLVSLIVISETVGYYYLKNGVPTLLKRGV